MRRERGVALVLVLMITAVIGLLVLYSGLAARQDVELARRLQDRTEASLAAHSELVALAFTLLTEPWVVGDGYTGDNPYRARWNFRNEPFDVEDAVIRIQDENGMLPVPPRGQEEALLGPLLGRLGVEDARARRAVELMTALQKDMPLQSFDELRRDGILNSSEVEGLRRVATLYPVTVFNPTTASSEALGIRYKGSARDSILELRARGELSMQQLSEVTGEEVSDIVVPIAGPAFRIQVEVKRGETTLRREVTLVVTPTETIPLTQWSSRSVAGDEAVPP